jgi:hypothetical protein
VTGPTTTQVEQQAVVAVSTDIILEALARLFAHWQPQGEVYPGHTQDIATVVAALPAPPSAPAEPVVPAT